VRRVTAGAGDAVLGLVCGGLLVERRIAIVGRVALEAATVVDDDARHGRLEVGQCLGMTCGRPLRILCGAAVVTLLLPDGVVAGGVLPVSHEVGALGGRRVRTRRPAGALDDQVRRERRGDEAAGGIAEHLVADRVLRLDHRLAARRGRDGVGRRGVGVPRVALAADVGVGHLGHVRRVSGVVDVAAEHRRCRGTVVARRAADELLGRSRHRQRRRVVRIGRIDVAVRDRRLCRYRRGCRARRCRQIRGRGRRRADLARVVVGRVTTGAVGLRCPGRLTVGAGLGMLGLDPLVVDRGAGTDGVAALTVGRQGVVAAKAVERERRCGKHQHGDNDHRKDQYALMQGHLQKGSMGWAVRFHKESPPSSRADEIRNRDEVRERAPATRAAA
jgi:hypothetical protein